MACGVVPLFASAEDDAKARPNIVLISVDSLRADHLEVYGYERKTAPAIARLAAGGVRFDYAISQGAWTLPSMATIHTALYPTEHGAINMDSKLDRARMTLAEGLRDAGYHTIAVTSHVFVSPEYGMDQGFVEFDDSQIAGHDAVSSDALSERAQQMIASAPKPFFLWVHYFDPHFSYIRHPEFQFADDDYHGPLPVKITERSVDDARKESELRASDISYVEDIYDEEIAHTDRAIGRLIDGISAVGLADEVVYIFTADHGEYFMERGRFFHGRDVYNELVRVPLVIGGALDSRLAGKVVTAPVETRSIAATAMALAGVEEHDYRGQDLLAVARSGVSEPYAFSEGSAGRGPGTIKIAIVGHGWKLIHVFEGDRYELYDLARDPSERKNRIDDEDPDTVEVRETLKNALAKLSLKPPEAAAAAGVGDEQKAQLRALGYGK